MIAKSNGGTMTVAPAGNHKARCVRVIDLGTQQKNFQGEAKLERTILVGWELPEEKHTFADEKGPEPFMVQRRYKLSLHEKANLAKHLESWRGKTFTQEERDTGFDLKKILGQTCLLNLVHAESNGNTYANISSVTQIPKGTPVPNAVNPLVYFSLDKEEFSREVFDGLSDKLKDTIKKSPEWAHLNGDNGQEYPEEPF